MLRNSPNVNKWSETSVLLIMLNHSHTNTDRSELHLRKFRWWEERPDFCCISDRSSAAVSLSQLRFGMDMDRQGWSVWILLLGLSVSVNGITRQDLLSFGSEAGDQQLSDANDDTRQISLNKPVTFYNKQFDKIYVSISYLYNFYYM